MTSPADGTSLGTCPHFEAYRPLAPEQIADPFPILELARREAPVFFSEEQNSYVVTRYEDLCEVLANPASFSNAGILKPYQSNPPEVDEILAQGYDPSKLGAMIMLDPPVHTRIRRMTSAGFTPRRVAALEEAVRATADELIDKMLDHGPPVDFIEAFAHVLPLRVILTMLGLPISDGPRLHKWASQKLALQFGSMSLDDHIEAATGYLEFQRYVGGIVEERRRNPGDDLISILATATDEGEALEDAMIVGQVMGMVNAGHETITILISVGLYHMLERRSLWEALCQDPALAATAVEEALRFDAPVKQLSRIAVRDVTIGGVDIPAGSRVVIALGSGNRDSDVFEDPDDIDLRADRPQHLAFSRGIHFCLGAALARLEGRVAFEQLAHRLPSLRLPDQFEIEFLPNITVRMPRSLLVEWD